MEKIKAQLRKLEKKKVFDHKYLVAIGRLEHIDQIQDILASFGVTLNAIVDNDKKKHGLSVNDVQVHAPEEILVPFNQDRLILIYSPKYWREILDQFEKMDYQEDKNLIVLQKPELYSSIKSICAGNKIYHGLQKEFGRGCVIFVCSCPLGDFYLLGLYFRQYIKINKISSYVIVGNSKGISKLSELFQFKNVVQLDADNTELLIKLYVFMGNLINIKVLTIWQGALCFNPCMIRQQGSFTFMDTFKHFIYRLEEKVAPQIPDFDRRNDGIEKKLKEKGLIKDKTVIIVPYSYSIQSLPISFWQTLADRLKEQGYCVAVNIDETRETNLISGTEALEVQLKDSVCAVEYAGIMIGIRSGFYDVTSSAKCKRVVLYPKKLEEASAYHWNCTDLKFNSLNAMGLCEDAIEIEFPTCSQNGQPYIKNDTYDQESSKILIDQILATLT